MSFKTLFTVATSAQIDRPEAVLEVLDAAVSLARREDAHLEVLALGIDRTEIGYLYPGVSVGLYQQTLEAAQAEATRIADMVRARLGREDVRWSVDAAVTQVGGIGALVAARARFADLAVLPLPYGTGRGPAHEAVVEAVLFDADTPVLALPDGMTDLAPFGRVVIGWNQGQEALAAIRAAIPILKQAGTVDIAVIDPTTHGPERSDPGGLLSQMLARHGIRAEVSVLARTLPRISDVIARHLRDRNADLLVMGAYGHSRLRQAILGGTTRNLLEGAQVPVFLAH